MQMSGVSHNMVQCQSMKAQQIKEPIQQSKNNVSQSTPQTNSLSQNKVKGQVVDIRI